MNPKIINLSMENCFRQEGSGFRLLTWLIHVENNEVSGLTQNPSVANRLKGS
jgi:hypothetical protein